MSGGIQLFADQVEVVDNLRESLKRNPWTLVFASVGFGKTVLAAWLITKIIQNKKRVLFVVHRKNLIKQTAETFKKFGIPFSYIDSKHHFNPHLPVQIASCPSLANRLGCYDADYVFFDEAHLSMAAGWWKVAEYYKGIKSRGIGLTGSPERLDGKPLGKVWDNMVEAPSMRWLIDNGRLQRYRPFESRMIDLSRVRSSGGDYNAKDVEEILSGKKILGDAVKHWKAHASWCRTISFCRSVSSAHLLAQEFNDNGVPAIALDAETPDNQQVAAYNALADRQISVIFNCLLFTEGFDIAAQVGRPVNIECVMDLAPTKSLARHIQKHGRGLRKDDGPDHILMDMVGGFANLGYPCDDREWSLSEKVKNKSMSRDSDALSVRKCPKCFTDHIPRPVCPSCGYQYPIKSFSSEEISDEMVETKPSTYDAEEAERRKRKEKKTRAYEQSKAETLKELIALGRRRGMKNPEMWAAKTIMERMKKKAKNEKV